MDDISYKLFAAKDVARILGINANMLFHWIQTKRLVKPTIVGQGRGKRNYFSLEDLSTLGIVKALNALNVDLYRIRYIVDRIICAKPTLITEVKINSDGSISLVDRKGAAVPNTGEGNLNIWQIYKKGKELFDKRGFVVRVWNGLDPVITVPYLSTNGETPLFPERKTGVYAGMLGINVLGVIEEIEKRTGLEL